MNLADVDILALQYAPVEYGKDDFAGVAAILNAVVNSSANRSPITIFDIAKLFGITDATGARDILNKLFSNAGSDLLVKVLVDRLTGVGADVSDPIIREGFETIRANVGSDLTDQILALGFNTSQLVIEKFGRELTDKDVSDAKTFATNLVIVQTLTNLVAAIYTTVADEIKAGTLTTDVDTKKRIIELAS